MVEKKNWENLVEAFILEFLRRNRKKMRRNYEKIMKK